MASKFMFLICFNVLFSNQVFAAADLSDFDADVEESFADADAARGEALEMKDRAASERESTEAARRQAADMREKVASERKKIQSDIEHSERERVALKAETKVLQKKMKKEQSDLVLNQKKLSKTQNELANVQASNKSAHDKEAQLQAALADQERVRQNLTNEITNQKASTEKAQFDSAAAMSRLEASRAETGRKKTEVEKHLAELKARHHEAQIKTAAAENEIRQTRIALARMEEETTVAEDEVRNSDSRLADAAQRLQLMREKNADRAAELKTRQASADEKLHSHARESQEARLKVGENSERQVAATMRAPSSTPMSVQLHSTGRVLARNCQVFPKPDAHSHALGLKAAGSKVTGAKQVNSWIAFPLSGGRTGFVSRACF